MGLLSNESVSLPAASFVDGLEFEETFAEPAVLDTAAAPRPRGVEPERAPEVVVPAAPPRLSVVPREPEPEPSEALYQDQLERRLREAETLVKQTIERMRTDEEQRLALWVRERRDEEERRLQQWIDERRLAVERSLEQRSAKDEGLAERIRAMLAEWQERFEQRLEQRRADEDRVAERRRQSDEERLRVWRAELEQALTARFAERRFTERAPLPDRTGELRSPVRDAIAAAASARDVGRILRDLLADLARTSAFALSLHHGQRDEVAYRYRVAAEDELGALLRRESLDDGPRSAVAHMDGWVRSHRPVRVGSRNVVVHTAQRAIRAGDAAVGVLTLQSEDEPIADAALARVTDLVALAAPRLAELRETGSFRGA